jgi:hypothetical protein
MSSLRPLPLALLAIVLAACTGSPGATAVPSPSAAGSPPPSTSPEGGVDHPTGATDVVLRIETGGGFVPIGWNATQAPWFTLYGDGTVIARDELAPMPDPGPSGLIGMLPFYTTKLDPEAMQTLLRFALTEGGLGLARPSYETGGVADAPTTTFRIVAGGIDKTVSVYALGFDPGNDPDAAIKAAFTALVDRLRGVATDLTMSGTPWEPERWRGVLMDDEGGFGANPMAWPWADIAPADFVQEGDGIMFARRVMTAEELAALEVTDLGGGVVNIGLVEPDGSKTYQLAIRPLLPDETS